jgi:Ulp1 family protease
LLIVFYIEFFDYIDVTDLQPFHLSSSDMECLEPGRWLHDNIITATQRLLQIQYPEINGLQSPVLGQKLAFAVHSNGAKFIQILNVKRNHWIMVTSITCETPNELKIIYDSLPSPDVPFKTQKQIASLFLCSCDKINLIFPDLQKQEGTSDCGLFSLAFATSVCAGQDPSTIHYIQNKFRSHLASCLKQNEITLFPKQKRKRKTIKGLQVKSIKIYCSCRLPEEGKMI